jgi:hypothetical protein
MIDFALSRSVFLVHLERRSSNNSIQVPVPGTVAARLPLRLRLRAPLSYW